MALYNANLMIRESRKAQGLTQEQLAEGICSRETIVKLEKGERKPNWFIFTNILRRLGLDPDIYHGDVVSEDDIFLLNWQKSSMTLINTHKFDELKAELDRVDAEKSTPQGKIWQSGLGYDMLLRVKANFYSYGAMFEPADSYKYLNPALAIECTLEILNLTRPGFDIDKIPEYFLAAHENRLLDTLAKSYAIAESPEKAIDIYTKMKLNIDKNYSHTVGTAHNPDPFYTMYMSLLVNMALALEKVKRWEDSMKIAEEGASLALSTERLRTYGNFLCIKANALRGLGRKDEYRELSKKTILFAYLLDGHRGTSFSAFKQEYEEKNNGEKLDLSVPW